MGGDDLVRQHDLRGVAQQILISTKALVFCERGHDYPMDNQDDDAQREAYAQATAMFNRGEFHGARTREEVVAAIKAEIDEAFFECPPCEKIDGDD